MPSSGRTAWTWRSQNQSCRTSPLPPHPLHRGKAPRKSTKPLALFRYGSWSPTGAPPKSTVHPDMFTFWVLRRLGTTPEKKKAYTTTTARKPFGELFWPQRKTFQVGGGYKNPIKTRKTISTTEIFPLWTPCFPAKKCSALEQGGVCFLFPSTQISGKRSRSENWASIYDSLCGHPREPLSGY